MTCQHWPVNVPGFLPGRHFSNTSYLFPSAFNGMSSSLPYTRGHQRRRRNRVESFVKVTSTMTPTQEAVKVSSLLLLAT